MNKEGYFPYGFSSHHFPNVPSLNFCPTMSKAIPPKPPLILKPNKKSASNQAHGINQSGIDTLPTDSNTMDSVVFTNKNEFIWDSRIDTSKVPAVFTLPGNSQLAGRWQKRTLKRRQKLEVALSEAKSVLEAGYAHTGNPIPVFPDDLIYSTALRIMKDIDVDSFEDPRIYFKKNIPWVWREVPVKKKKD